MKALNDESYLKCCDAQYSSRSGGLTATALRLAGGALVAVVLARGFGLEGAAQQAGILQASMPTAVITIILATEYDVEPAFVTSVVFLTTLVSPLTLTPLLSWLR